MGSVRGGARRSGGGGTAVHGGGARGGWHAFERCVAHKDGRFLVRLQHPSIAYKQATLRAYKQATGKTVRRREQPLPETGCFLLVTPFKSC